MPEYRVYIVGSDGHFQRSIPLICAGDDEAKVKAQQLVDGHDLELWQRDRKIASFEHNKNETSPQKSDRQELER